jgi:threonine dehydrogenase-like Zn-dependent dehydrogenase
MNAIAALPGSIAAAFVPAPCVAAPAAGEVLCQTLQLGICGTDREILHSLAPACPVGEPHLVLGHECLARIAAVGPGVTDYSPGDLVVPVVRRARGHVRHRVDMLNFDQFVERGIFFEHGFSAPQWLDRPEHLHRVDPAIASLAVLAEPLAVSEKACNEAALLQAARLEGEWRERPPRVLVTGMGPIGFTAILASVARGWPVTMWGRDPSDSFRARAARRLGANYTSDRALFAPAKVDVSGFDLILECTGSDEVLVPASAALASRGVMVWLGSSRVPRPRELEVARMMRDAVMRNHIHLGTVNAAARDFRDALDHLAALGKTHGDALAALITARVSPKDALWHFDNREPQGIKTVVEYA